MQGLTLAVISATKKRTAMQCSSQEFKFWGPRAPTLQNVGDI